MIDVIYKKYISQKFSVATLLELVFLRKRTGWLSMTKYTSSILQNIQNQPKQATWMMNVGISPSIVIYNGTQTSIKVSQYLGGRILTSVLYWRTLFIFFPERQGLWFGYSSKHTLQFAPWNGLCFWNSVSSGEDN